MVSWFGGKQSCILIEPLLTSARISKTMGESFKLHAQALIGYVDEINMDNVPPMPHMPVMGMEAAY